MSSTTILVLSLICSVDNLKLSFKIEDDNTILTAGEVSLKDDILGIEEILEDYYDYGHLTEEESVETANDATFDISTEESTSYPIAYDGYLYSQLYPVTRFSYASAKDFINEKLNSLNTGNNSDQFDWKFVVIPGIAISLGLFGVGVLLHQCIKEKENEKKRTEQNIGSI